MAMKERQVGADQMAIKPRLHVSDDPLAGPVDRNVLTHRGKTAKGEHAEADGGAGVDEANVALVDDLVDQRFEQQGRGSPSQSQQGSCMRVPRRSPTNRAADDHGRGGARAASFAGRPQVSYRSQKAYRIVFGGGQYHGADFRQIGRQSRHSKQCCGPEPARRQHQRPQAVPPTGPARGRDNSSRFAAQQSPDRVSALALLGHCLLRIAPPWLADWGLAGWPSTCPSRSYPKKYPANGDSWGVRDEQQANRLGERCGQGPAKTAECWVKSGACRQKIVNAGTTHSCCSAAQMPALKRPVCAGLRPSCPLGDGNTVLHQSHTGP